MDMTLRWYGSKLDSVTLQQIRQIPGVTGVISKIFVVFKQPFCGHALIFFKEFLDFVLAVRFPARQDKAAARTLDALKHVFRADSFDHLFVVGECV